MPESKTIRLDAADNVVTASVPIEVGTGVESVTAKALVPRGHKIASRTIPAGGAVLKYAQVIGYASEEIQAGAHVHTHNLSFRSVDQAYDFSTDLRPVPPAAEQDHFMGYRRANGRCGTRNFIAVLTSVNCSATAARQIAAHFTPEVMAAYPNVDGVTAFVHGTGCGMAGSGDGFEALQRVMWGYARHPNVAGVLMVGLGCEMNQIDWLMEAYGLAPGPLFQAMNIQDVAGLRRTVELGVSKIEAMLPLANEARRSLVRRPN
jgi:altronate hydrolase